MTDNFDETSASGPQVLPASLKSSFRACVLSALHCVAGIEGGIEHKLSMASNRYRGLWAQSITARSSNPFDAHSGESDHAFRSKVTARSG